MGEDSENVNRVFWFVFVQRDGASLASGSGFYGVRVSVAAAPKTSVASAHRDMRVRAVMAPQKQERSPASTGAVSVKFSADFGNDVAER